MAEETGYPELLRTAIKEAKTSRRKLSFELADRTGNKQDSEYRSLGKYLRGDETPSPERAALLAVMLATPELALVTPQRRDRLGELSATVDDLIQTVKDLNADVVELQRRLGAERRASGER